MGDEKEKIVDEQEPQIPVFTVLKNGAILKNIFIVNKPPPPPHSKPIASVHQETEEILIVGRHPDCNIVLTHPSVSRFHLQILSNPSSHKLYLTDLSSVHGTWVSDKRIEPGVRVELSQGDTLRVGGSSRVYRLHWIPLSHAYENAQDQDLNCLPVERAETECSDMIFEGLESLFSDENIPSEPPMPEGGGQSEEGGDSSSLDGCEEKETECSDMIFEGLESLFSDENIPSEPPMPEGGGQSEEGGDSSSLDGCEEKEMYETAEIDQVVNSLAIENTEFESTEFNSEVIESLFCDDNLGFIGKKEIPSAPPMPEKEHQSEHGGQNSSKDDGQENHMSSFWAFETESVNLFLPLEGSTSNSTENQCLQLNHVTGDSELESSFFTEKEGEACPAVQVPEETESQSLLEKDQEWQSDISCLSVGPFAIENSSLLIKEVLGVTKNQQVEEENLPLETKSNLLVNLDGKSTLRKDYGQTDKSCLSPEPLEYSDDKEEGAYPATQIPERTDDQISLCKDHRQTDDDLCLWSGPLIMENSSLLIREDVVEAKGEQFEENNLTPVQKLSSLVNLDVEHSNEISCLVDEKLGETENRTESPKNLGKRDPTTISFVPLVTTSIASSPADGIISKMIYYKESQIPQSICTAGEQLESEFCESPPLISESKSIFEESIWARRGKPASVVQIQTDRSRGKTTVEAGIDNDNGNEQEVDIFTPDKENLTPNTLRLRSLKKKNMVEIKLEDAEQEVEIFTPNKENFTPNTLRLRSLKKKNMVEIKLDDAQQEEEIFTPDKENFTPNTLQLRSLKKKGKVEVSHSKSHKSFLSSNIHPEDLLVCSEKENQKLKDLQERKSVETTTGNQARLEKKLMLTKLSAERMPFQSLLKRSAGKNRSEALVPYVATRSNTSLTCSRTMENVNNPLSNKSVGEGKRGWTVVADTTTLLDKESRKSLQFLQGLQGTHLIIPRMVIRELDCLKQRGSLFRKKTEACLVLEWIEECMVKTKWWIHVQSSAEDGRLIAPTPPASPQSLFNENSWGFTSGTTSSFPYLRCRSSMELESPAAEDHILDCALLHRKMSHEEQLVLLSNDITLKIKAMAEGLICETAQEFHESLVNPISKRFMWAGSCPRGRTWSYLADVVLAEKYNRCPLNKSSKGEGAKGLKLILLHNAHYGHIH